MLRTPSDSRGADSPSTDNALLALALEVRRGETRFPRRPISSDRFLIGSGEHCDLQLGSEEISPLHCLIRFDGELYELDAVADAPQTRINGTPVLSSPLMAGDEVEIGEFVFGVVDERGTPHPSIEIPEQANDFGPPTGLEFLSSEQLVDLIDAETTMLARHEHQHSRDGMALLHAIRTRSAGLASGLSTHRSIPFAHADRHLTGEQASGGDPAGSSESVTRTDIEHEIAKVVHELQLFSQELTARFTALQQREAVYADGVSSIAEMQQRLMDQLEHLVEHVGVLQQRAVQPRQTRAIA